MRIRGKKALGEMTLEVAISIVLMAVLFVALLFISHNQVLKVNAIIEADKVEFACRNNLVTLMNFKYDDTYNYEDKLIVSYITEDYTDFNKSLDKHMKHFLEPGTWTLEIDDFSNTTVFGKERLRIRAFEDIVSCSILVPLPCTEDCGTCLLNVSLENKYEK